MPNGAASVAAAFLLIVLMSQYSPAQQPAKSPSIDLGSFTKEVMVLEFREGQTQLALWLPYEFFVAATVNEGKLSKEAAEKNLEFLIPYQTMFVQNSIQNADGSVAYADEKEVRARASLRLADGSEIAPLNKVPPLVTAVISGMKSLMTSEGDAGSANMHILIFPAHTAAGQKIVNTSQRDQMTLKLKATSRFRETSFTWRTPFDSLKTVPNCPRCKAGVSAKWSYCPYCGQKLPPQ